MTTNQILNLPIGALLMRKTKRECDPQFGMVIAMGYSSRLKGEAIVVAWEQESHPLYQEYDFSLDEEYPEDKETWRDASHWIPETVPVVSEDHKTWWRNWKRVA
jgi:hypothetical protein